ncbi:MAG: GNAT family N-acetyltransferase [Anaerolineales bacterium]|nr:GNAT family N-acetyltransferase [Anaerolineales bacterium]MCB9127402.1 GNAT family N-acetyltransferase [Ardenticatenales bacterium]
MIRHATTADLATLTSLAVTTWRDAFGPSMDAAEVAAHCAAHLSSAHVAAWLRDDVVLVAERRGARLVGYAHLGASTMRYAGQTAQSAELRRLYVQRSAQNGGIGSALIEASLRQPLLRNADAIYLQVWEQNRGAIRLYERHGFTVVDRFRYTLPSGAAGDWEWVMRR